MIFNKYWKLASHHHQTAYLASRVTIQDARRCRVKDRPSEGLHTLRYTVIKDNKEVQVCCRAFLNIHSVSVKIVRDAIK